MKSNLFFQLLGEILNPNPKRQPNAKAIDMREVVVDGKRIWVKKEHPYVALLQA